MTDIGKIIIQKANEQGLSIPKLAVKANLSTVGLYKMLQRKDLKISRILQFSATLQHDFLQYYQSNQSPNPEELKSLQHENQQLKQQIETLHRENSLLTDMLQILKAQLKL